MAKRRKREWILDGLVVLLAVVALSFLVRDRLLPWLADRSVLDPGETVRDAPSLLDARTGRPMRLEPEAGHLLLVFRSTCPACARAWPGWKRLARDGRWLVTAVGLEAGEAAAAYVGRRLPSARIATPADVTEFTRRFRIGVVPTTLVIDRGGRLAARHAGPLEEPDIEALRLRSGPANPQR